MLESGYLPISADAQQTERGVDRTFAVSMP